MASKKSNMGMGGKFPELKTLKDIIRYTAEQYETHPAFVIPLKGDAEENKSFRRFSDDIDAFGTMMFSEGFQDGCRIAVLGSNSYEWLVAYFAVANGGNTVVPLDRDLPTEELAALAEKSGCKALVYAPDYADVLPAFQKTTGVQRYICMNELEDILAQGRQKIAQGGSSYTNYALSEDSLAAIVYTSGTTGKSKGVMLTQRNIASDAMSCCRMASGEGRTVLALPLHHTFGMLVGVIIPLLYGGTTYISKSVRNVQKDMVKTKSTVMFLVPAIVEVVYKKLWETAEQSGSAAKLRRGLKISRFFTKLGIDIRRRLFGEVLDKLGGEIYLIVCGGAPLNKQIVSDFCAMGIDLLNGYGITECSPVVSVNKYLGNTHGSAGLPLDCNQVRIDQPDEKGVGEIQIKGSNVMTGYYGDEEETREAFTEDGWFKTQDLGYLDKDGFLFITGRLKHLIILSNGKNVSPEELEDKIKMMPGVAEVAVFARKDQIVAEIYAGQDASKEDEEAIRGTVYNMNRGQPSYKHISVVEFRDTEFPKTTSMKIKKHSLK